MNKKYFIIFSLSALVILAGGLLAGCDGNWSQESSNNYNANQQPSQQAPAVEEQNPQPAPADVTASDINLEIQSLDSSIDTVKTSGFEATNLNDKDLGL
jgi:hypothetical protein